MDELRKTKMTIKREVKGRVHDTVLMARHFRAELCPQSVERSTRCPSKSHSFTLVSELPVACKRMKKIVVH
jgi:hypothetical protein